MKAAILLTSELGTDTDYIIDVKRKRGENWTFYICEEGQPQITEARRKAGQTFSGKELDELYIPLIMADSSGSVMEDLLRAGIVTETLTDVMMQKYPSLFLRLLTGYRRQDDLSPYEMSFSPRSIPQATRAKLLTRSSATRLSKNPSTRHQCHPARRRRDSKQKRCAVRRLDSTQSSINSSRRP